MSATGRGGERAVNDAYYTPEKLANKLVDLLPIRREHLALEPHVGGGAFYNALRTKTTNIDVCDIGPAIWNYAFPSSTGAYGGDYLEWDGYKPYDWIVGNPPYQDAMAHVLHSFDLLSPGGNLCFLLRLAFLESKKRVKFWVNHPAHKIWVLAERPSFTGGGTDNCAYGFFWWKKRGEYEPRPGSTMIDVLSWR